MERDNMYMIQIKKTFLLNQELLIKNKKKTNFMQVFIVMFLLSFIMISCHRSQTNTVSLDSDNTGKNVRDIEGGPLTPESQSNNQIDVTITQKIRAEIVKEDSLSINAKNIKIITLNGIVTLRGPVENQNEKDLIYSKAQSIAGTDKVINQLEIVSH